jgi:hypothetical protein
MLFMERQQVQPAFIMPAMQSQQAWIIAQQWSSPLVQVTQTPILVASHLHMPIVRLQQQTIMPFIIAQQLHIPPAIMVQRFCSMVAETLSSQVQLIFMPPGHFSNVMVQRGTITMFPAAGAALGPPIMPVGPAIPIPGIPIPVRSIIMAVVIAARLLTGVALVRAGPRPSREIRSIVVKTHSLFQDVIQSNIRRRSSKIDPRHARDDLPSHRIATPRLSNLRQSAPLSDSSIPPPKILLPIHHEVDNIGQQ